VTRDPVSRWALAVRVLAVLSFVLLMLTIFEARALRASRTELQQLRSACPQQVADPR
jgi:hypothetical protein